jgi:hypothetical protein
MLRLTNLSSWPGQLARFARYPGGLAGFLWDHDLDGVELIQAGPVSQPLFPRPHIVGWHLPFWLSWLDFYRGDQAGLRSEFPNRQCLLYYFGGAEPGHLREVWRRELILAESLGARYAVVHVAACRHRDVFTGDFSVSDEEVVEAFIRLLNETVAGLSGKILILLENLWWPGLTLLKKDLISRLLTEIDYPNLGLVLDCSHLMNVRPGLPSQKAAVAYLLRAVEDLGPWAGRIQAVHLNRSFCGAGGVKARRKAMGEEAPLPPRDLAEFQSRFARVYDYIGGVDPHLPFTEPAIGELLRRVSPAYLVHELVGEDFALSRRRLAAQVACLRRGGW